MQQAGRNIALKALTRRELDREAIGTATGAVRMVACCRNPSTAPDRHRQQAMPASMDGSLRRVGDKRCRTGSDYARTRSRVGDQACDRDYRSEYVAAKHGVRRSDHQDAGLIAVNTLFTRPVKIDLGQAALTTQQERVLTWLAKPDRI